LCRDAEAYGLCARLAARADAELAKDCRDVVIDRLLGDEEPLGDVGVAMSLRDEGEDFELA